ncbi:MAG: nuclear transport factor 2 family protein [Planctomycetes bacterium]|nr:nuclear transport factor 2 family protein [Planctomycetota bacterium]
MTRSLAGLRRFVSGAAACSIAAVAMAQQLPAPEVREVAATTGATPLRYVVQLPAQWTPTTWTPLVVRFVGAGEEADGLAAAQHAVAELTPTLAPAGWVVVAPERGVGAAGIGPLFAALRRSFRIEQGGVHAICSGDGARVDAVRTALHEVQTVTFDGPIEGGEALGLQGAAARRVGLAGKDELAAKLLTLHAERALDGAAGEVARVLDDFHDAAANGDGARYFADLPDDAVFLGTDGAERWTGAEFRRQYSRYFDGRSAWTYAALQRHVTLGDDGATAWFDEVLDNQAYGECRGSGVLVRRGERWVLRQYNLTIAVPNDLAGAFAKRVRALQGTAPLPVATVVVVRHAEKLDDSRDPPLDDAGRARAERLAAALRDLPLAAIYCSEFARTAQTVAPAALAHQLTPQVMPASDRQSLGLALRRLHDGRVALVCGHSNTVPALLKALGVADAPAIGDDDYDHLFVVTLQPEGARCVALRF